MKVRSAVHFFGLFVAVVALLVLSGCVTVPAGPSGAAAVKVEPVKSSNGLVRAKSHEGSTFFIKSKDTTEKGIDLTPTISQGLANLGLTPVPSVDDAYYVIDLVCQNFKSGKIGTTMGTEQSRTEALNNEDYGGAILGEIIGAAYPSYCSFEVDLVIDELKPAPVSKTKKGSKQGKSSKSSKKSAGEDSIQTATVLTGSARYVTTKSTEPQAISAVSASMSSFIVDMFK